MKTRLQANLEILKLLRKFLKDYPDQRFHQALYNLDLLKDDVIEGEWAGVTRQSCGRKTYNVESVHALEIAKAALEKIRDQT